MLGLIRSLNRHIDVGDVVRANLTALEKGDNDAYNIGTNVETTTLQLYNEIANQMSVNISPSFGQARKGDLHRSLLNCKKAKLMLGWQPQTLLADGIARVIEYFRH